MGEEIEIMSKHEFCDDCGQCLIGMVEVMKHICPTKEGPQYRSFTLPPGGRFSLQGTDSCGGINLPKYDTELHDDIDLQLLFVVMGTNQRSVEQVVVKVERTRPDAPLFFGFGDSMTADDVRILRQSFDEIRAAVDALDEKPPVPRIELSSNIGEGLQTYRLYLSGDGFKVVDSQRSLVLDAVELQSLCALAGKQLPIWEPKSGTWEKLATPMCSYCISEDRGHNVHCPNRDDQRGLKGVEIWRYTRRNTCQN